MSDALKQLIADNDLVVNNFDKIFRFMAAGESFGKRAANTQSFIAPLYEGFLRKRYVSDKCRAYVEREAFKQLPFIKQELGLVKITEVALTPDEERHALADEESPF